MMKRRVVFILTVLFFSSLAYAQEYRLSVQDSLLSIQLIEKGRTAGRLGDFEEAINNFEQLYKLRAKIFGSNSYRLATIFNNIGIQYKNLGNIEKALEAYKKAESLYINKFGKEHPELGSVYSNIGNLYQLKGDYNKALEYKKFGFLILSKDSVKYATAYQSLKYNLVETQLNLGQNKEAIRFAKSNLKYTTTQLRPRFYDLIALAYFKQGEYDLATQNYLYAIKAWIDLYGENNVELGDQYLSYASFLVSIKDYNNAFLFSSKAKALVLKFYGEKSSSFAQVQKIYGDYYFMKNLEASQIDDFRTQRKKYLNEAIQYYQNAIVALVDSFEIKDPFVNPKLENVISEYQLIEVLRKKAIAMDKLADIYLSEFDKRNSKKYFDAGLSSLNKATQLIHRLQIGFESEDSKYFLTQNFGSIYYDAIRISYKLYNQTKNQEYINRAFEFSERSRSSNLLASIKDVKAKEFGGIPDSLLKRESYFKNNITNYTSMLIQENHAEKPDSQKVNLYSSKIFRYTEDYNKLINSFEKLYPSYYALKYENKIVGVNEIQANLSTRQALIEFFVNEPEVGTSHGELYRFLITKDSVNLSMEQIDSSFGNNIQIVFDFLTNPNYLFTKKKDFIRYATSGYGLYAKLLEPLKSRINGKDLTIIPQDKLSYIPFDALLTELPDTSKMNFRDLKYLIRDFAINYSYSATLLYDYAYKNKRSKKSLLVFSPLYDPNTSYTDPETMITRHLAPLPGANEEVRSISRFINADTFTNQFAQEQTFKDKAANYDVLHLAMHTIINDSLPMFSKLVFTKPESGFSEDGYLNTYEIYNMKLNARLAVLSACETGTGKLQKGEGVMSMARGFIFAGCPSIVMTLWQVEDKSGVKIMEDFYSFLSKGKRKDVALRMAKLKHLSTSDPLTSHPHYWLGYVNIGNSEPLYTSKRVYFVIFIIVAGLLLFGDWYIRKRPRKSRSAN